MIRENQQLELTWKDTGKGRGTEPRARLVEPARAGGSAPSSIEAVMEVCGGPRCPCLNIHFPWQPSQVGQLENQIGEYVRHLEEMPA